MAIVREPDPETRERARRLYEDGLVAQTDIALMLGLADTTLRRRIQRWGWTRHSHDIPDGPLPIAALAAAPVSAPVPAPILGLAAMPAALQPAASQPCTEDAVYDRRTTIERVRCAVDREIAAVEAALSRLGSLTRRVPESERAARTLASLVKTLTELKRLETASDEGEADDGFPVSEVEDMPDIASDACAMAFGDFARGYLVVDRLGVRVLRDPYSAKPYVLFYTTKRVGGGVRDFDAIKLLKFGVS